MNLFTAELSTLHVEKTWVRGTVALHDLEHGRARDLEPERKTTR